MKQKEQQPLNYVEIHPISIKEIKRGHPWIIADKFTEKFSTNTDLLVGTDKRSTPICLFLNDPKHSRIKGRVWSFKMPFNQEIHNFPNELHSRLDSAIKKRVELKLIDERDNFFIVFGEADFLPGLFIQMIGNHIFIQFYAYFWTKFQPLILRYLKKMLSEHFPQINIKNIWVQMRGNPKDSKALPKSIYNKKQSNLNITEFGIKYNIKLGFHYDIGIYTDMAAIRKKIIPYLEKSKSVLNLFSYSGAFSLLALKLGAKEVVSVDSAQMSMEWLRENLKLNGQLDTNKHLAMEVPAQKAISQLQKENKKFDFLICDPPSSSNDGRKISGAIQFYENQLGNMVNLLSDNGHLLLFINTHKTNQSKFESKIKSIILKEKLKGIKIKKMLSLSDDCPTKLNFEEGSYLKGILLEKISL